MPRTQNLRRVKNVYAVVAADGDTILAGILQGLVQQNLEKYPERVAMARKVKRPITVTSVETDESVTLLFSPDGVMIESGVLPHAVGVFATVDQILDVARLRVVGIVPVGFASRRGFGLLTDLARRRLRITGLFRRPLTAVRFIALVSVA